MIKRYTGSFLQINQLYYRKNFYNIKFLIVDLFFCTKVSKFQG